LGIMFIINMISAVMTAIKTAEITKDGKLSAEDVRKNWWRDERSNKSWMLFDQFQFMSYYIIVAVFFPTQLVEFCRLFDWANLDLPLPGYHNNDYYPYRSATFVPTLAPTVPPPTSPPTFAPAKKLLNYGQYANGIGNVDAKQVFWTTLVWWGILTVGAAILYTVFALLISICCGGLGTLMQRLVHIIIRICMIAYVPVLFTGAYHTKEDHGPSIAASIIIIIVLGFGLPAFAFFIVSKPSKPENLFEPDYKLKFGSLYGAFHYKRAKFCIIVFVKKFLVSILLGFLAWDYFHIVDHKYLVVAQIIPVVFIMICYIVVLIIIRPFLDHVHLYVEIGLHVINFISLLIAFSHLNNPSLGGEIAVAVLQIVGLLLCIGAYINSWMMMVDAKSIGEIGKICGCGSDDK